MLQHLLKPLASEQIIDFWSKEFGLSFTWQRPMAKIVKRVVEANDTVSLWLKPNSHFKGFKAGQHINITVRVNGVNLTRSYSLSNAPKDNDLLRITVKKEGKVSSYLCQQAQVGDTVQIGQGFGELSLHKQQPHLLLAAGSGITPLMSLLSTATTQQPIILMYWAKTRADLCFMAEIKRLITQNNHIKLHVFLTQEANLLADEQTGRFSVEKVQCLVTDLTSYQVIACGNHDFINTVHTLKPYVAGLQSESFTPITLSNTALGTVRVELKASQKVLELNQGDSLLDALEKQGIYPPSGCRMGICHTCSCQKISGVTQDLQNGELVSEAQSAVKLCVNRAYSDLVLDI